MTGPPQTYYEYKARVEAKLAAFRDTGLSRYGDGRAEWAEYVAYQQAQHSAWLAYEQTHYPTLTFDQGQKALADARAAVVAAGIDPHALDVAVHALEVINYELWNTSFEETAQRIELGTEDLSDPLAPLRASLADAQAAVDTFQHQVDNHVRSSPPAAELLNGAQIQLDAVRARLAAIEAA